MDRPALAVLQPASLDEAVAMLDGTARIAGGATALQLDWARGVDKPETLVSLGRIAALQGIERPFGQVRIGAMTTLSTLAKHRSVLRDLPLLSAATETVASLSVRNLATLGGNIAGRTGCLLPALLALDAQLEVARPAGIHRESLVQWLARAGDSREFIACIILDIMPAGTLWTHRKIGLRATFTPSVISVAGLIESQDGRVEKARFAVGGGAVAAARLMTAEADITGQVLATLDWERLHATFLSDIRAPDDAFRTARYRSHAAANALVLGLGGGLPGQLSNPTPVERDGAATLADEIRLSREAHPERWHIRPDLAEKLRGTFPYLTDRRDAGMLVGRILRAGQPHARILSIDTRAAEALPGVVCVVTHRDVPGENAFGILVQDQPALCHDKVRYVGDAVAAVAAVDGPTAERALGLIKVEFEALPLVTDPKRALADDAPRVHEQGNLQCDLSFSRGNTPEAFKHAIHIVERTYVTPRQMHGFLETEGGYARVEADGSLAVFVGGQHGARDRLQLSRILALPEEKIRVVTSPTGGAFGGKDELTVQPALALLALKSGRPVRLHLSRAESVAAGIKRNPMTIRMRTGCDAQGLLVAQEVEVLADGGAYASLGPSVLETALEHATGPYVVANIETKGRMVYTNNGVCGAFRGFGANQMTYAIECQMDLLAEVSGLTPVEIRRRNLRRPGTPGFLGQTVAASERMDEMLDAALASPLWTVPVEQDRAPDEIIGVGMAMNYQGNGLGSVVPDPAGGRLALGADGMIEAGYGLDEMGQGLLALIVSTVAQQLGCGRDDVRPVTGDTQSAPDSGSTTASRGTYVVWEAARRAGPEFTAALLTAAAKILQREPSGLKLVPGGIGEIGNNSGEIRLSYAALAAALDPSERPCVTVAFDFPKADFDRGNARYMFAFGACLARVAVSRVTGQVRVLDLQQHTAAGPVMDMAAYLGQIEGGAVQGLGFTLSEDALMDDGAYVTANFDTYMMPGMADAPQRMAVFALESLDAGDPFGPRGAGELGIGAVTPAIANAVANAIGTCPVVTPFSPETILDAMAASA